MLNRTLLITSGILLLFGIGWFSFMYYQNSYCFIKCPKKEVSLPTPSILSFKDCEVAGYAVMESYPRQCKTPDGKIFIEVLGTMIPTYVHATSGVISVTTPTPNSVTGKEFEVRGSARGWYFEGSFPIEILDMNGKVLTTTKAQAQSDWMTSDPVSFIAKVQVKSNYIGKATVILKKDNPSGLSEHDASMSFPITIEY